MRRISRRQFIKKATISGATIATFPMIFLPRAQAVWTPRTTVHPNVDNLRVVGITDHKMTTAVEPVSSWTEQDRLVATEVVWENIDKLASALVQTPDPVEAWRTIFIKPPKKSWSDVTVAIKTNNISYQHTRSAVMAKIVHTLTDTLGVKPFNTHIYDAVDGYSMSQYTPFVGLPEGTKIEDEWGGITTTTRVPAPWKNSGGKSRCVRHLVDGSVDILVNIALCKGHSRRFGGFTMTMKNHLGTFAPGPAHQNGSFDYLLAINQTPEILGRMDKRTGKVLYPRQQLCLIDALWASEGGPGGRSDSQPNFLAMGVMSPILDYLVATTLRGERLGWEPNMKATRRMLTEFGYEEGDLPAGGKIIEI
ncbi:MAG: DUF362 domain-containing protein [Proteobacteria bacterium]|nr:DUF362 domain-containing protein [Pseudomonadota bacterium]